MNIDQSVSVIVPVYNIQDYIGKCLDSIICQTYSMIEIIVIDDGSSDNSGVICDKYKEKDNRIKVIHKRNGGLSSARNVGIQNSSGEILVFVDGDDWIDDKYIETLITVMKERNADIVCCASRIVFGDNTVEGSEVGDVKEYSPEAAIESLCYNREMICAVWGKMYKRELFDDIRFPVGKTFEDMAVAHKLFDKANKIAYVDYFGHYYYQRRGSILNSGYNDNKLDRIYISEDILKFVKERYPNIINSAYCRCLLSYLGAYKDLPFFRRDDAVWNKVKAVRSYVIHDKKCSRGIRMLALLSYGGKAITKTTLKLYAISKSLNFEKRSCHWK